MRINYTAYIIAAVLLPCSAQANWTFVPGVSAGVIAQEAKFENQNRQSVESITLDPSLTIDLETKKLNATWTMNHQHLIREGDDGSFKDDFNTYQYEADLELVEGLLNIQGNGALNLLNLSPGDYLVSDRFLNPELLTKTRRNNVGLLLNADNNRWLNIDAQLLYTDVASEQQNQSSNNLDGSVYTSQISLNQGDAFETTFLRVEGLFSVTKSDGSTNPSAQRQADQKSRELDFFISQQVINEFGVVFQGSNEAYQFESIVDGDSRRDFTSYGVGISYIQSPNRYVALTYNQGERDQDKDYYLGGTIRWAFSARTNLRANFGKRYYGDSGDIQFNYNTRNIRASFSYREQVTNFSRLLGEQNSLGVFVCPSNDLNISSCYQPNSLNVQLEPGEQLTEFSDFVVEVSDEPVLIKSSVALLGYSKTRFSSAIEFRYSNPFYEDSGREQLTYTTSLSSNYELGSKTDFRTQLTYIEAQNRRGRDGVGASFDDTIMRAIAAVSYKMNENLLADFELRFIDRDSSVIERKVRDRRLSITLKYTF